MRQLIFFVSLSFALTSGVPIGAVAQSRTETAPGPLSEAKILTALKSGGITQRRLVTLVSQYGVDFSSTPEIEERLRAAGANDELVEAIGKAKATPKAPAQAAPVPAPAAVPSQGNAKFNRKDGLAYVWIPAGTFQMGCSPGDSECGRDERPAHTVTITKGFWMGQTEVTQAAYQRVMGTNPSYLHGDRLPVEQVSWHEANAYCTAVGMRLPTEAEWEYAARAGSTAARDGDLDAVAWYSADSGVQSHEVGQKEPNEWTLYDMLGNVWEWVADWYDEHSYSQTRSQDPGGPSLGSYRALRGGSWYSVARVSRVSHRYRGAPGNRSVDYGFRCAGE